MRLVLVAVAALSSSTFAATAVICDSNSTYPVNDGTVGPGEYAGSSTGLGNSFGGVLGAGATLSFDSDALGNLAFALSATSATCAQGNSDSIVIYVDSRTGGFTDTTTLNDFSDQGRAAASGMGTDGTRSSLAFAQGFAADYAIVIQNNFSGIFRLVAGGPHVFVKTLTRSSVMTVPPPCVGEWTGFSMADLGAQLGGDLRYVATLLNSTNGFRSNEYQGVIGVPATGGVGPYTLGSGEFNVFTPGPGLSYLTGPVRWTFESYAGTGFQPTPICGQLSSSQFSATGWSDGALAFGGTRTTANTDYTRGFSSIAVTTGGFYSFEVFPGNRVFGIQPGGSDFAPGVLTLGIQNLSSATLDGVDLAYTLWHRNDQGRSTSLNFAFSTDGNNFVDLPALSFTTLTTADALGWQQAPRSVTLGGLALAPNQLLYLRFSSADVAGTGSRDELGLDDITLTPRTDVFADFGDAPASYGSAGHMSSTVFIGASVDGEFAQQPSANALLDDTSGNDDEDGVTFGGFYEAATTPLTVVSSAAARISVWVDWNQDGAFGAGEQPVSNAALVAGNNTVNVAVPSGVTRGATFMRVRVASANPTQPTGPMADGEVEDYAITIGGCGDGLVNGPEQCDSGGVGTGVCGCLPSCTWTPATAQCGSSPNGACDAQDTCDGAGTCSANFLAAGTECRVANGACDVAETCTGSSPTCPADAFASSGVCRVAAGPCDLPESCDGSGPSCPADQLAAGGICRVAADTCDISESCTGTSAACPPDVFAPATTSCRASTGVCDVAEVCTGFAATCPADGFAASTVVCRAASGACDLAETCSGLSGVCPADGFAAASTVCRAANGACDVAELCSGASGACPSDAFASSGVCRAAAGACDVAESCNGTSAACPNDALTPAGTECRASAGTCDVAEVCSGATAACPNDGFASSATTCRPSAGPCDIAEGCTGGSAVCPADTLRSSATVCRTANGLCDVAESCSGTSAACPNDGFLGAGTVCRTSAGACDVAELCSGSTSQCPVDAFAPSTQVCRAAAGACDVAERCTGAGVSCPADQSAPDGTACNDTLACNGPERCMSGACASGMAPNCADNDACTMDMCMEPAGCSNVRIPGCCSVSADCDDNDACTMDSCPGTGQMCMHLPVGGCVNDGGVDGGTDGGVDGGVDGGGTGGGSGTAGGSGAAGGSGTAGGMASAGGIASAGGMANAGGSGGGGAEEPKSGCGCNTADPGTLMAFALLALVRRRRS